MFNQLLNRLAKKIQSRFFILSAVFVCLFVVLISRIFYLQIIKGESYQESFSLKIQKTQSIDATRGMIYDRNGNVLAYNELTYAVTISDNGAYDDLSNDDKNDALNQNITNLLALLDKNGEVVSKYLYIKLDENGEYEYDVNEGSSRNRFIADVYGVRSFADDLDEEQQTSTADELMTYLCEKRYHIDQEAIGKEMTIRIANIRYAMSQVTYSKYLTVTVAENVSDETVTYVKENGDTLIGVDVKDDYIRHYNDAVYFSSVIGYTGVISYDEYAELSEEDDSYALNDIIGKAGIEQYMDTTLRGVKGSRTFYVDSLGNVLQNASQTEPVAGGNLYLSLDRDLQVNTYKILEQELAGIILKKLTDSMTYDPHEAESTYSIAIPIGDVYIALIDNSVIDLRKFSSAESGSVQAQVYESFLPRQQQAINNVIEEVRNPSGDNNSIGEEYQDYLNYIASDYLRYQKEIIDPDKLDTTDEVYKAWNNGTVSFREYLNHAVSKGWINTAKLEALNDSDSRYVEAEEVVEAILTYLNTALYSDTDFSKIVYKYMILDYTVTGKQLCLMLYEQGVLEEDTATRDALNNGSISPYSFLYEQIYRLRITPAMLALEPCTASAVITDPDTGEVLACVSYPGYDTNKLVDNTDKSYYNQLLEDKSNPLYNYATQQRTAPGSTFKMVTATAGLEEGVIDDETNFECTGLFKGVDPNPKCWSYPYSHGYIDVETAIQVSCNVFFFNVGYNLGVDSKGKYSSSAGIEKLTKYAEMYGFDAVSGIELTESEPNISGTDSVRSAIGQGENVYTNAQMARYVTTLANGGTVYDLTLLDHLTDADGKIVEEYRADVHNTLELKEGTMQTIQTGMRMMVDNTSQFTTITQAGFSFAGKTGTSEESSIHPDHVLFVGYAPYEDPQIAFSIRIANGYTSAYTAEIAADLVKYQFDLSDKNSIITGVANSVGTAAAGD